MASSDASLNLLEKIPPQSRDAEMSVLGAMLFEEAAFIKALEILRAEFFYEDSHRKIFSAMVGLFQKSRPIDLVTVSDELKKNSHLEDIGGVGYLTQLTAALPTAAHVDHYAHIVKEKALLRGLIHNATDIVQKCYEPQIGASEALDKAEKMIFDLSQSRIEGKVFAVRDIIHDSMEMIDKLYQHKAHVTGLATGFTKFDEQTAGLQPSDLIVVAGRPSMGKSAFATGICENVAINLKKHVAFFSLEMSKEQLVQRMLCSVARVNAQKVRTGYLSHEDFPRLTRAAGKLSEGGQIFIDDTPGQTVLEVRAKARRLKMQHDIQLVVIDYMQLMQGIGRAESRQQEISEISRSLKALARELKVPVIAVSQLSRAVENRTGNRPQLSDLRESGAIEQDADVVVFLFREEYYKPDDETLRNKAEAIIAKQRNGPVGSVELLFIKDSTRFENPEFHHSGEEAQ